MAGHEQCNSSEQEAHIPWWDTVQLAVIHTSCQTGGGGEEEQCVSV